MSLEVMQNPLPTVPEGNEIPPANYRRCWQPTDKYVPFANADKNPLKGIVQRKLRWVEIGIKQQVLL
jgi:hypothetical protein